MPGADDRSLHHDLLGPTAAGRLRNLDVAQALECGPRRLGALGLSGPDRRRLRAAAELARRHQPAFPTREPLTRPEAALAHFAGLRRRPREVLAVLLLDGSGRALGRSEVVAEGSSSHLCASPREVFGSALRRGAEAVVLAHNHPSGMVDPSAWDLAFTRTVRRAGELLGIAVLDHLIVAERAWTSLRRSGLWALTAPPHPADNEDGAQDASE